MVQLSVIIVNYNVRYHLEQCLQSVEAACKDLSVEIIVVDNNSKDGSYELITKKFPAVILIKNNFNAGFAKANNQGVAKATGQYVLILNPDTVVEADTFSKCLAYANTLENPGAIGVKLIDGTGHFLPESKRNIPTPRVAFNKTFGNGKVYYVQDLQMNNQGEVPVLVGAFMLLKKDVYTKVGGFDEDYFMYGEDIDLCYKLLQEGFRNYYLGATTALHYKGESTLKDSKYLKHFHGAMSLFYKKHFKGGGFRGFLINWGIKVAHSLAYLKLTQQKSGKKIVGKVLYLGSDLSTLKLLENRNASNIIKLENLNELSSYLEKEIVGQIIFDNNLLTYTAIIETITALKDRNISFRTIPRHANFYLGSDQANAQGEIISW